MTRGGRIAREHFKLRDNGYFVVNCGVCEWSTASELLLARHLDSTAHRAAETKALEVLAREKSGERMEQVLRGLASSGPGEDVEYLVRAARQVIGEIDGYVLEGMS